MFTLTRSAAAARPTFKHAGQHICRAPRGRMLVECLVAMLLLAVTGQLVVSLAHSVTRSADSARLTTAAWALSTLAIESALAAGCDSAGSAAITAESRPRVALAWSDRGAAVGSGLRERDVTVRLSRSPLSQTADQTLQLHSARSCP